mgnify:CR=1 FL=1
MNRFISFGEVLLRLSSRPEVRLQQAHTLDVVYGGSEANVAAALAQWEISSAHVTVLPDSDIGQAALRSLRSFGIETNFIGHGPGRMGIYYLEPGSQVRSPRVIYDRFHSSFAQAQPQSYVWPDIIHGASWFHWSGITPAVSANAATACRDAIVTARAAKLTISADINYRRVLWQYGMQPYEIMPELIRESDVIVGSAADFSNCLGIPLDPNLPLDQIAARVHVHAPRMSWLANTIRVTHHAHHQELQGELWYGGTLYRSRKYDIQPVVDRVGSGDAFVAGLIHGRMTEKSPQEVIEFATAAAVFKHSVQGDVICAHLSEIEQLMSGSQIGKLLR